MRLSMDLELQDVPGKLLLALQPFGDNKANIISVVHHRDRKTPHGMIPVRFVVEMDRTKIEAVSAVVVGHVLHNDLGDTTNCIDSTGFAEVMEVSLTMTGVDEPSSAYFSIPILALI